MHSITRLAVWSIAAALGSAAPAALSVAHRKDSTDFPPPAASHADNLPVAAASLPSQAGRSSYRAELIRVVDGDTLEARVALWLDQSLTTRIRLRDIDAPELSGTCPHERERAITARQRLAELVAGGSFLITDVGRDKYGGRVVARIETMSGLDVGQALVSEGHARVWQKRRGNWC